MKRRRDYIALLKEALGDRLKVLETPAENEILLALRPGALGTLPETCALLTRSLHARFTTLVPSDERPLNGSLHLYYIFSLPADDLFLLLRVGVEAKHMEVPSITGVVDGANWFEREMKDTFGIVAFPNIARLAVHPDWPEEVHPMLRTTEARAAVPRVRGTFEFPRVEGEGVFEIPVGPVHAGIIEPGHFRFSVAGEPIINLDAQLFYTHKGTEKIAEGESPGRVLFLAERVSGDSSFAHAVAFCHAVERLSGCRVPPRALRVRTLLLELERLYNHCGDIGALLLDVGFAAGAARAFELKEAFLRTNEILTGSRLLRSAAAIGGVRRDPEDTEAKRAALRGVIARANTALPALLDLIGSSSSVIDRLETTGRLSQAEAWRLGVTGIAARASGIERDYRRDHPHALYGSLPFRVAVRTEGDVLARLYVRAEEALVSLALIRELMEREPGAPALASPCDIPPGHSALGYVEGWRGEVVHWVLTDKSGGIYRWKITDPSFHNWRGLLAAVRGNIVPDFPVINKSFNLSYSGNDR